MSVTPIDLTALEGFGDLGASKASGKPLVLDIAVVHEDPNQPRKTFDDGLELAASIAEVGVLMPISVRPHPEIDGHYIVKLGARRRRAAISAGLTEIPAWIDDVLSDFDQVIENLQRKDLTPMELAQFIAEKQYGGMKQAAIAQKLGISRPAVAKYLALVNAPPEIEAVYRSGRNTSPDTLFDLRTLYTRFPEETASWLADDVEVSRRSVDALKRKLTGTEPVQTAPAERAKARKAVATPDPSEIKRPIIAVKAGERFGIIVLNRRAEADHHVLVKWDDTAETDEVACSDIHVLRLDDARRYEPINRGLTAAGDSAAFPPAEHIPPT